MSRVPGTAPTAPRSRPARALVACVAALGSACLAPAPVDDHGGERRVAVEPRMVMDGAIELGQRAHDRIVVDEVIFHAPTVRQHTGGSDRDVLATDAIHTGPLLFRYDIGSSDGFGDVLGGARTWVLHDGDEHASLEFSFSPFTAGARAREALESSTGVLLDELAGHTAFVHGYVMMSAQASGFGGTECDGDPDGNPADCRRADGDPDGNPAGPEPESDGDPDGNPARPGTRRGLAEDTDDVELRHARATTTAVPFLLVLSTPFTLRVPLEQLLGADVEGDEVLPLDLHLSLAELFSAERVGAIEDVAQAQSQGAVVLEVGDTSALDLGVGAGVRRAGESATGGGIRVTGDLR